MDVAEIAKYLEGKLYSGEIIITHDGNPIPIDLDNEDYLRYDEKNKILDYTLKHTYSGRIDFYKIAERILDDCKPKDSKELNENWENILLDYFSFGDY